MPLFTIHGSRRETETESHGQAAIKKRFLSRGGGVGHRKANAGSNASAEVLGFFFFCFSFSFFLSLFFFFSNIEIVAAGFLTQVLPQKPCDNTPITLHTLHIIQPTREETARSTHPSCLTVGLLLQQLLLNSFTPNAIMKHVYKIKRPSVPRSEKTGRWTEGRPSEAANGGEHNVSVSKTSPHRECYCLSFFLRWMSYFVSLLPFCGKTNRELGNRKWWSRLWRVDFVGDSFLFSHWTSAGLTSDWLHNSVCVCVCVCVEDT